MAFRSLNVESLGLKTPLSHATEVEAGGTMADIVKLTVCLCDVGRAGEVSRLVPPDQLAEIEAVVS